MADDIAVGVALAAAAYEAVAVWTRRVPTITAITKRFPKLVRAVMVSATLVWAIFHFEVTP
jgi:hypothetical protein